MSFRLFPLSMITDVRGRVNLPAVIDTLAPSQTFRLVTQAIIPEVKIRFTQSPSLSDLLGTLEEEERAVNLPGVIDTLAPSQTFRLVTEPIVVEVKIRFTQSPSLSDLIGELDVTDKPPAAPDGAGAFPLSPSQVRVTWADNSDNESGFRVYFAGTNTIAASAGAGATAVDVGGLGEATLYSFEVVAYNSAGQSHRSNVASARTHTQTPAAPTNLVAVAVSPTQIDLTWADNSGNESGFEIYLAANGTLVGTNLANDTTFSHAGLTPNTFYTYMVRAYRTVNGQTAHSDWSNIHGATTPKQTPPAPLIQSVTDLGYTHEGAAVYKARVSFTGTSAATGWFLQVQRDGGSFINTGLAGPSGTWDDTSGLSAGAHSWRARWTENSSGTGLTSDWSTTESLTLANRSIAAPSSLGGFDSSFCSGGTPVWEKTAQWNDEPAGWESELQGEYAVVGNWESPVQGQGAGSLITTTSQYSSRKNIETAQGAFNTYRVRFRRSNANAPGGFDTSAWAQWTIITGAPPCPVMIQNFTATYRASFSHCAADGITATRDILLTWTNPNNGGMFEIHFSLNNADWTNLTPSLLSSEDSSFGHDHTSSIPNPTFYYRIRQHLGGEPSAWAPTQINPGNPCIGGPG